ncbi:MAG: hypothetical protein AVDCRST_MAG86-4228 [uncultured Truepera sp.]|uniref:Uncharacterized protein n=1 Tax=uncultured Truepera sp. TaxID=543023 RepID=A0A6J4VU84_9DEIN|nr:MAG: hypothetical protein AVDCRST_MAG86-4228 [uncultured Truepera sp.]
MQRFPVIIVNLNQGLWSCQGHTITLLRQKLSGHYLTVFRESPRLFPLGKRRYQDNNVRDEHFVYSETLLGLVSATAQR